MMIVNVKEYVKKLFYAYAETPEKYFVKVVMFLLPVMMYR